MGNEPIELHERPIPDLTAYREARAGFRQHPIDAQDPRSNEALVDVRSLGIAGENLYYTQNTAPYYERIPGSIEGLFMRESAARALVVVNERLQPLGLELFCVDCWRPQAVQQFFYETWFPAKVRKEHPQWSDEDIEAETAKYWSRPAASDAAIDPLSPPPHSTGGVVDLTLRKIGGEMLWMGTTPDDGQERAHTDYLEKHAGGAEEDEEARSNRRVLYAVMTDAGFMSHPNEWWHYSRGDQMWAKLMTYREGKSYAAYYTNTTPEGWSVSPIA